MALMKLETVSLGAVNITEKMVQEHIADDPSILGLGELELRDNDNQRPVLRDLIRQAWEGYGKP